MIKENTNIPRLKTRVRGIRADEIFWNNCKKVAKSQKTDVNKLIVSYMGKYCGKKLKQIEKNKLGKNA